MAIAFLGVGAIGTGVAAALWDAGRRDFVFCVRGTLDRWVLESVDHETVMTPPVLIDCDRATPVETIFLATKAHQTASVEPWLRRLVKPSTMVVVLQNGIDALERVTPLIGVEGAEVIPAVVQTAVNRLGPGRYTARRPMHFVLPARTSSRAVASLFVGSGAKVELTDDFVTAQWAKLAVNAVGGLAAIVNAPLDLRRARFGNLARAMLLEIVTVARAEGAHLERATIDEIFSRYQEPGRVNSILADRRAGLPLEYEARNAVVVERARRHGIEVPINATVTALLGELDALAASSERP